MSEIDELLRRGQALHQEGQLDAARAIYDQLLAQLPNSAPLLNLRSLLARQLGNPADALHYSRRALAIDPTQAAYHANLAEAHRASGGISDAIECYRAAILRQPQAAVAHLNLGLLLEQNRQVHEALACFARAADLAPHECLTRYHLAEALERQKRLAEAIPHYEAALHANPMHLTSLVHLASIRKQQREFAAAEALLWRAAAIEQAKPQLFLDLGNVLQLQQKWQEAAIQYRRALKLSPGYFEAWCNLGNALREAGQLHEARQVAEQAVALTPNSAAAHSNLGVVLQDVGELELACYHQKKSLEYEAGIPALHNNLATLLKRLGHVDEALAGYQRALELDPCYAQALCSQGMARLSLGDFKRGWAGYEFRIGLPQFGTYNLPEPRWNGGPLNGRTLLIHAEQGLGDTFQFIRLLKPTIERAGDARVILAVQEQLLPILSLSGFANLVPRQLPLPPFDVHTPLLSLPHTLGIELETIPADIPYLAVEQARVGRWRNELLQYDGFKVGIAWQGRPTFREDRERSIPVQEFAPLAGIPGVRLMSLQQGPGREQLTENKLGFSVIELPQTVDRPGEAFLDSAAIMQSLDLVVTSDTATAHLAGALGVPVWVALSFAPDWRWLQSRSDSPWYPTMRLFRQRTFGQWSPVFSEIGRELERLARPR
jgi:tetratricopeptide (TPR) repeat protein